MYVTHTHTHTRIVLKNSNTLISTIKFSLLFFLFRILFVGRAEKKKSTLLLKTWFHAVLLIIKKLHIDRYLSSLCASSSLAIKKQALKKTATTLVFRHSKKFNITLPKCIYSISIDYIHQKWQWRIYNVGKK